MLLFYIIGWRILFAEAENDSLTENIDDSEDLFLTEEELNALQPELRSRFVFKKLFELQLW